MEASIAAAAVNLSAVLIALFCLLVAKLLAARPRLARRIWTESPSTPLAPLLAPAVAKLLAARSRLARRRHRAPSEAADGPGGGETEALLPCSSTGGGVLHLCHPRVAALTVPDDQMAQFEEIVHRIYCGDFPPLQAVEQAVTRGGDHGPPHPSGSCGNGVVKKGLEELRVLSADLQSEMNRTGTWRLHEPVDDVLLARLLVAADFVVRDALRLLRTYSQWRREGAGGGVPPGRTWLRLGLACVPFEDRLGRPVVVVKAKNIDPSTPLGVLEMSYRGIVDASIAHMLLARAERGISPSNPLEQYVLVIDANGAGRRNLVLSWLRMMVRESCEHYPDRLAQVFVIGANATVKFMWDMASKLVHPRTQKKICMVLEADTPEFMQRLVSKDALPQEWGGFGPDAVGPAALGLDGRWSSYFRSLAASAGCLPQAAWEQLGALSGEEAIGIMNQAEQVAVEATEAIKGVDDIWKSYATRASPLHLLGRLALFLCSR